MARRPSKPRPNVQGLLDERQALTEWLERLSLAGQDAADDVRTKVRSDYESRLAAVIGELQGFAGELREALSKELDKRAGLSKKEQSADIRLAEAKLRRAVGEYEDAQWNKIHTEVQGELVKVRKDLKVVVAEVSRLEDVLSSIDRKPAEPADQDLVPLAELEPDGDGDADKLATGDDGKDRKRPSGQTEAFDELEFLKKVAPDGVAKRRRSGASFKPIEAPEVPEPIAAPPEATATAPEESSPEPEPPPLQVGPEEDDAVKKTLKCAECGAMNRPTEWYCESCGAELAVV